MPSSGHGKFSIWLSDNVIHSYVRGEWSADTANRYSEAIHEAASKLPRKHWGHMVYLQQWRLGTPDIEPIITELVTWCLANGLTKAAHVYHPDMLKDYQINKMVISKQGEFEKREFAKESDAIAWLSSFAFNVEPAH
ncbi:hypothetical protein ACFSJY_01840 [Thalassotalea euphylliae]|uniref:hypothetical protein n=1 Tax=Thalassotalea euphylliae TaxID=1655234 RepID=UPI00362C3FA7